MQAWREVHTHMLIHTYTVFCHTHTVILRQTHLSVQICASSLYEKNTPAVRRSPLFHRPLRRLKPATSLSFYRNMCTHTYAHAHTNTLITSYFSPTTRKCTLTTHSAGEYIGHLIAASTHCSLCNMLRLCGYIALQTEGSPGGQCIVSVNNEHSG